MGGDSGLMVSSAHFWSICKLSMVIESESATNYTMRGGELENHMYALGETRAARVIGV
jgi:hypothetical protein